MKNLADYIMVIDDALDGEFCDHLVNEYEGSLVTDSSHEWKQDYRSFKELTLEDADDLKVIEQSARNVYSFYQDKCNIDFFPPEFLIETPRMKRYLANDHDQFGWHVDVGDKVSSSRFLVMFYYLNDVEEGGETIFEDTVANKKLTVKPKRGRMVVFPPMWMYPHKGMKPVSGSKFILSTYAHYK